MKSLAFSTPTMTPLYTEKARPSPAFSGCPTPMFDFDPKKVRFVEPQVSLILTNLHIYLTNSINFITCITDRKLSAISIDLTKCIILLSIKFHSNQ